MLLKQKLYNIIFKTDTPAGKWFDIILIISILSSLTVGMLDSVSSINKTWGNLLYQLEWFFTLLFTLEYGLRLYAAPKPFHYARSFYGLIDIMAILPTYFSVIFPGLYHLSAIRVLRVLRVFRILKLIHYLHEYTFLIESLRASRRKITVFISSVITLVIILGSIMYIIESAESGFTSIPKSIYWAIVTMTTVGYGDISPTTPFGQFVAGVVMILGYSILAVPAGLVTSEFIQQANTTKLLGKVCPICEKKGHDSDAIYCKYCAGKL